MEDNIIEANQSSVVENQSFGSESFEQESKLKESEEGKDKIHPQAIK